MAQIRTGVNATADRAVGALVVLDAALKPPERAA
jgi:hypothetical protein